MQIQRIDYIKDLQYKLYACKRSLETYPEHLVGTEYNLAVNRYGDVLKEKLKNPLCTELAMKNVLDEHPIIYKKAYTSSLILKFTPVFSAIFLHSSISSAGKTSTILKITEGTWFFAHFANSKSSENPSSPKSQIQSS